MEDQLKTNLDSIKDITNRHREEASKFRYYLIALCVSSIAFAIYQTKDLSLGWKQLPAGIAVLLWSSSIFLGFKVIKIAAHLLYLNVELIRTVIGMNPMTGTHPEKILIGKESLEKLMEDGERLIIKFANWQERFFFGGLLSFGIWHVMHMAYH